MSKIRVVVHGALCKMGQEVIKAVNLDIETELTGVVDQHLSKDSGEIPNCPITVPSSNQISELLLNTDVIVDFTNSEDAYNLIKIAPKMKKTDKIITLICGNAMKDFGIIAEKL